MFEIVTCTQSELRLKLGSFSEQLPAECREQLSSHDPCGAQKDGPFVQLAYDEIDNQEIDRLLGYAEIPSANAPIGLNGDFAPVRLGTDPRTQILVFSLSRLEEHLNTQEPGVVQSIRQLGSMDAFVAQRGDAMTATEYLTSGVLACIEFCKKNKQALVITW